MIRYVLAVILTVAILGVSMSAVEYGAGTSSEQQIEGDVVAIEQAATSLLQNEELPPTGQPGPQRVVTVSLPDDTLAATPVATFKLERTYENHTLVTYRIEGRTTKTQVIPAPIVYNEPTGNRSLELGGSGVEKTLVLTLERDESNEPVVVISHVYI